MKITMDKKWAQRQDPTKEVRVLCVDGPKENFPVIYVDESGNTFTTSPTGSYFRDDSEEYFRDLVPLQEKVADVWLVLRNDGTPIHEVFNTEGAANEWVVNWGLPHYKPYSAVRMTQYEEKS